MLRLFLTVELCLNFRLIRSMELRFKKVDPFIDDLFEIFNAENAFLVIKIVFGVEKLI